MTKTHLDISEIFNIKGKLALITGSSRGLGRGFAEALAQAGAGVIIHGRDPDAIAETAAAITADGGNVVATVQFDVGDAPAVAIAIEKLIDEHGVPDILVNNAGLQRRGFFTESSVEDWDAVISSNLSSAFYVSRYVTPGMVERGSGKVINIGSVQSMLAIHRIASYVASKGGVAMLTKAMAAELTSSGVQVNTISPGYFATEMNTALVEDETFNNWVVGRTPARRWGDFSELWGTLIYLASDASNFVSGQNIFVDGGMTSVV